MEPLSNQNRRQNQEKQHSSLNPLPRSIVTVSRHSTLTFLSRVEGNWVGHIVIFFEDFYFTTAHISISTRTSFGSLLTSTVLRAGKGLAPIHRA